MFNQGKFNQAPFNVRGTDDVDILFAVAFDSAFHEMIASGGNVYGEMQLAENVGATAGIAAAVRTSVSGSAEILQAAVAYGSGVAEVFFEAAVLGEIHTGENLSPLLAFDAVILAAPELSSNRHEAVTFRDAVQGLSRMGADVATGVRYEALLDMQASTVQFDVLYATLSVTIPTGSTLVIDSGGYVVLLDGLNAIAAQSGDWLFLDRTVHDVVFEPLSGGALDADKLILYQERWL